jgi:hypothetical protein
MARCVEVIRSGLPRSFAGMKWNGHVTTEHGSRLYRMSGGVSMSH